MKKTFAVVLATLALPVYAETMYVTERLSTALRAAIAEGNPTVKMIEGGAALEVLERVDRFARVRDAQGAEGWIETRLLSNTPPARPQLDRVQAELTKLRTDLATAQTRTAQLEARLSQETARGAELAQSAEQAKARAEAASQAPVAPTPTENDRDFSWGWLVLAFAMLWLGFGAGVVWVRERHRKRLGGMYLRI